MTPEITLPTAPTSLYKGIKNRKHTPKLSISKGNNTKQKKNTKPLPKVPTSPTTPTLFSITKLKKYRAHVAKATGTLRSRMSPLKS